MKTSNSPAEELARKKEHLAERMTNLHFEKHPELVEKYGEDGWDYCYEDALYHIDYLVETLRVDSPELFNHYLEWAYHMLSARDIPMTDLVNNLNYMKRAVYEGLSEDALGRPVAFIDEGIKHLRNLGSNLESHLLPDNPLLDEAKEYLRLLLNSKRQQAARLIDKLVERGESVSEIYEHIFQATQYEVGVLWQRNEISVAHEHYCTAATQLIMSRLYPIIFSGQKKGAKLVACSVSNELHEIGIRMVSDFFEMDGWDTYYLGGNMPAGHLAQSIGEHKADVVAISVTLPVHINKVENMIGRIRDDEQFDHVKIMVGGYPFKIVPDLHEQLGADATADDARQAVDTANRLVS